VVVLNVSKVRSLREQKGWEQKELAAKANVNAAVVSRLERGTQQDFKISIIASVASALNVPIDALLDEHSQYSPSEITPELQSAMAHLASHPASVQNRIAAMVEAYLFALEKEAQDGN
jgi:transcriptional regulator with XRE-family HTH domain